MQPSPLIAGYALVSLPRYRKKAVWTVEADRCLPDLHQQTKPLHQYCHLAKWKSGQRVRLTRRA